MLNVTEQRIGDTTILHCTGQLTFVHADAVLRVSALRQSNVRILVLDLAGVDGIDAAGLGTLVALRAWSRNRGSALKLMNVNATLDRVLEMTKLKSKFERCSAKEMLDLLCRALREPRTEMIESSLPLRVAETTYA